VFKARGSVVEGWHFLVLETPPHLLSLVDLTSTVNHCDVFRMGQCAGQQQSN